jgi:hypothetical protein
MSTSESSLSKDVKAALAKDVELRGRAAAQRGEDFRLRAERAERIVTEVRPGESRGESCCVLPFASLLA